VNGRSVPGVSHVSKLQEQEEEEEEEEMGVSEYYLQNNSLPEKYIYIYIYNGQRHAHTEAHIYTLAHATYLSSR